MKNEMRVMTERPLNAETPTAALRSWITPNRVFFARNQGGIPPRRIRLSRWRLSVEGEIQTPLTLRSDSPRPRRALSTGRRRGSSGPIT